MPKDKPLAGIAFQFLFSFVRRIRYSNNAYLICDWHGVQDVLLDNTDITACSFVLSPTRTNKNRESCNSFHHAKWFFCQKACPDLLSYHDSYCVGGQIDLQSEMFIVRNRILISCYNVTHNPFCGPYW